MDSDLPEYKELIMDAIRGAGKLYRIKLPLNLLTMLIPNGIASTPLRREYPLFRDLNRELVVNRYFDEEVSVVSLESKGREYWIVLKSKYLKECVACVCNVETLLQSGCKCGIGGSHPSSSLRFS